MIDSLTHNTWTSEKVIIDDVQHQFQTPSWVCDYMVSKLPEGTRSVLEPTPGEGNIVSSLMKMNYLITAPEDYFLLDKTKRFDAVVMNPPFSSKYGNLSNAPNPDKLQGMSMGYEILYDCMEMSDTIIALMPWFTLIDSEKRLMKLSEFGLKSITHLPRKVFNYARITTCIIELRKGFKNTTNFNYLKEPYGS